MMRNLFLNPSFAVASEWKSTTSYSNPNAYRADGNWRSKIFFGLTMLLSLTVLTVSDSVRAALPMVDSQGEALPSLAPMIERVQPAVVNISTFGTQEVVANPLLQDPFFRRFFGAPNQRPQKRRTQSAGSGVIVDAEKGTVITNYHVIKGADEIHISLSDKRVFDAELIGSDPDVDIAILKIDADNLIDIPMADSDKLRQGDFVVALGNPFGLENTVTSGVVSALGRSGLGLEGYENFIQTDASINHGNSGGALVNLRGELVGINTAIIAPSGGNVGIGLAIPVNMAKNSMDQILETGEVKRGQLGVVIQDLTRDMAEAFDLPEHQTGVVIAQVRDGSPAEKGGLKADDVVVQVDGKRIDTGAELRNAVGSKRIGEKVTVKVLRNGKTKKVKVEIGEPEKQSQQAGKIHPKLEGVRLEDYSDTRGNEGVEIVSVVQSSPAAAVGFRKGDIIVSVNSVRVSNIEQLETVAEASKGKLVLRIIRGGVAFYLVLR